ncbi:MAG: hypothetical protein BWK80_36890 [Desulfobacteraceae bacterium IS3]|nr:MAG: hypothetical protein BWK80_36890 [Desulfobacteraceae bacterium IS3]HAO19943.1 hypothetical protein [Desulfobacteraceae bacterium]
MLITINVPDTLPHERLMRRIRKIEENFFKEAKLFEKIQKRVKNTAENNDPWSNPDAELPCVDTGIADFSINHDHYLYGTPKNEPFPPTTP